MEIPLITLIDRMSNRPQGLEENNGIIIKGIRLLTPDIKKLECSLLYVGVSPPNEIEYEPNSCAVYLCEPMDLSYCALFLVCNVGLHAVFNELLLIIDLFDSYEQRLKSIIYEQKGLQALILLCSEVLGNPAYLVDSSFKVLAIDDTPMLSEISAIWKNLVNNRYLSYDIVVNLRKSNELTLMESYKHAVIFNSKYFNNDFINYNLRENEKIKGHFFAVGYLKKITSGDVAYANHLGKMVLLAMSQDIEYTPTRGNDYENFFCHMLTGTLKGSTQINRQLKPLGWEPNGKYMVFFMQPKINDELINEALCSRLEGINSGKPLMYENGIVSVFPVSEGDSASHIEHRLHRLVAEDGGLGGLSDEFDGFHRLDRHYEQAKAALTLDIKNPGSLNVYRDYALFHVLKTANEHMDLQMVCEKSVFRLRDYDAIHGTDYFNTLYVYLKNERSIVLASYELNIHRNTLKYRLEKMNEIHGVDLNDSRLRQRIALSFWILRVYPTLNFPKLPEKTYE